MKKQGTEPPVTNSKGSLSQIVGYDDSKEFRDLLCLRSQPKFLSTLQVPLVAALGFEPTALGVCQATKAVLQYHSEGKAGGIFVSCKYRIIYIYMNIFTGKPLVRYRNTGWQG